MILAFGIDTSLPAFDEIREQFDLSEGSGEVSLVVTTYFLGMAAGQMFWGLLSDRFGRRLALVSGLVLYGLGAAGAAAAGDMNSLLAARGIWGVGAAAPSVLRNSISRDLYSGDKLARITSLTMAIFLIGPALAPSIGELILLGGSWRYSFLAAVPLAVVALAWTVRFGETIAQENIRPLEIRVVGRGVRAFCRSRSAVGFTLATTFAQGAFFVYLGSGQPIIDEIYGLGSWFALLFAGTAAVIGITVLVSRRFIAEIGASRVALIAAGVNIAVAASFIAGAALTNGRPPFAVWYVIVTSYAAFATVITPACAALTMTPMARVAGTASGLYGLVTLGGGALLAALVDRRIADSVTPMAVGFLAYAVAAFAAIAWGRRGSLALVEP